VVRILVLPQMWVKVSFAESAFLQFYIKS